MTQPKGENGGPKGRKMPLKWGVCKSLISLEVRKWSDYTTFGVVYMVGRGRGLVGA